VTYQGKVGLGITTWKRPERFRRCLDSVVTHLGDLVDTVLVVQDGGECYVSELPPRWSLSDHVTNRGWAQSKNECLTYLLDAGCDHLFMIEDDTTVTSPMAVTGYVDAALASGLHYLTAHPWGEVTTKQVAVEGLVTFWAYVGSWWTYMSAHGYRTGGGYNETLGGIMGDIELPQRWSKRGLTSGWGRLPDATGSEDWVKPSCLTIDQSTIANQPGWLERQEWLIDWWAETMPETMPCEIKPAKEAGWRHKCQPQKKPDPSFI
jgi:hypothetical protein